MLIADPKIVSITDLSDYEKDLVDSFTCGKEDIDNYLKCDSLDDYYHGITRTFCFFDDEANKMLGYFSLTVDRVTIIRKSLLNKKLKNQKNYVNRGYVPGIQIHHFGVSEDLQGKGLGRDLLDYVFVLIHQQILPFVGACLITVQSENDVIGFYKKVGFEATGQTRDKNKSMAIIIKELFE